MPYDIIIGRDNSDREKFKEQALVFLGKSYVKMGQYTSLSNRILLDVARSHVILVAGKRGCLTGETPVFTNKGYKKIKEFNEKEDLVLSFNKEKKEFEWEKAKLLEYPISKESILEIELQDGRKIQLTKEHPLLMNYGKYLFWRMAQELKEGDKLILPVFIPEVKADKESLSLARILGFVLSDGTISKRKGRWKDGRGAWYNGIKSRMRIFCDDKDVLETAKKDIEDEFGTHTKVYKRNDCNCSVVQSLHAKVVDKIHELGVPLGNKAGIITIPEIVWKSSNEFKKNFLSALFSCDGYIAKLGKTIDYSSKSRKFLEEMQIMLSHFSIESVIREKNSECLGKRFLNYRLFITDNQSIENFKKIGFISKYKQERLDKHKVNGTRRRKTFYISENLVCKKVKKVRELKDIDKVYDLSVDKNHSFIANGIISHNSGKSFSLGAIAEGITDLPREASRNIAPLIFDTMGVFWTMKFKNEKEAHLLKSWGLESKELPVKVVVPFGKVPDYLERGIPVDETFALNPSELETEDWLALFSLSPTDMNGVLVERIISKVKERKYYFSLEEVQTEIKEDKEAREENKQIVSAMFSAADSWGIFAKAEEESTPIEKLAQGGITTVLDISVYSASSSFNIRALVISLISRQLFKKRMDARKSEEIQSIRQGGMESQGIIREQPLIWLMVDEAHEFLPKTGKTPATDALIQILREGRQPGISIVLATQQPGQIHNDVMTQADIVLSHRITAQQDIAALNLIMQSYLLEDIQKQIANLPQEKGAAIILDDTSERIYPMRVRPRFTWHGGESPSSVTPEAKV